jgi:hypothetical protein
VRVWNLGLRTSLQDSRFSILARSSHISSHDLSRNTGQEVRFLSWIWARNCYKRNQSCTSPRHRGALGSCVYLNPLFRARLQSTPPAPRTSVCAGTAAAPGTESGRIQISPRPPSKEIYLPLVGSSWGCVHGRFTTAHSCLDISIMRQTFNNEFLWFGNGNRLKN